MFSPVLRLLFLGFGTLLGPLAHASPPINEQLAQIIRTWEINLPLNGGSSGDTLADWQTHWQAAQALRTRVTAAEKEGALSADEALTLRGTVLEALIASLRTRKSTARELLQSLPQDLDSIWLQHHLFGLSRAQRDFLRRNNQLWSRSEKILVASLEAQQPQDSYERRSAIANLCRLLGEIRLQESKDLDEVQGTELIRLLSTRPMCLEIQNTKSKNLPTLEIVTEKDIRLPVVSVVHAPGINLAIHAHAILGGTFIDLSAPENGEALPAGSLTIDVMDGENSRRPTFVSAANFVPEQGDRANRPGIFLFLVNGEAAAAR